MKFGLRCFILHSKMIKRIKFERIFFYLRLFLNPYSKSMLKTSGVPDVWILEDVRFSIWSHLFFKGFHEKQKKHICDLCGKVYSKAQALKWHKESVHEGKDMSVTCELCNKTFSKLSNLQKHLKLVHQGLKNKVCDLCGKSFGEACALKKHILTAHGEQKNLLSGISPNKDFVLSAKSALTMNTETKEILERQIGNIYEANKPPISALQMNAETKQILERNFPSIYEANKPK